MSTLAPLSLAQLKSMTSEQQLAYINQLAANQKAPAKARDAKLKVGEKGTVVISGIRAKYPVLAAYAEEIERMIPVLYASREDFDRSPLAAFINENKSRLSYKNTTEEVSAATV